MIDYRIEVGDAHAHRFAVTVKVSRPAENQVFSLPVWIPGSYLVREFARHLSPISAHQGGRPCTVHNLDKATWRVDCSARGALTLHYEVYAFDTSVRAAFLDAKQTPVFFGSAINNFGVREVLDALAELAPPPIGAHTDEVLAERLKLDAAAIAALRAKGAI